MAKRGRTMLLASALMAACGDQVAEPLPGVSHDAGTDASSSSAGPSRGANGPAEADSGGLAPAGDDAATGLEHGDACMLTIHTKPTQTVSPSGCAVLERDTSACSDERKAAGLDGYWLKFSCRVSLSVAVVDGQKLVSATSDGQPDYESNYFPLGNACHETYTGAIQNPNLIAPQTYVTEFPWMPTAGVNPMRGAVVGLALNGVPIFGDFAAPGDDIYQEAKTFDRCGAHPQMSGHYHYHGEPYSISYDDANFIGVMRDGYPIYGRRDADGSSPALDAQGGHMGVTLDSPQTAVYHYHVNQQTSSNPATSGQKQWFLTTGTYHGTPAACATCN